MSAVYASPAQYRCSCGRTFMNGISLERHQWVTKCAPAVDNKTHVMLPDQQARATQAAMAQAMRVLKEKQAVQQNLTRSAATNVACVASSPTRKNRCCSAPRS